MAYSYIKGNMNLKPIFSWIILKLDKPANNIHLERIVSQIPDSGLGLIFVIKDVWMLSTSMCNLKFPTCILSEMYKYLS